jgi:hypothetical protein
VSPILPGEDGYRECDGHNIQYAFDNCEPGCIVELDQGDFYVSQVVARNFVGDFKGADIDATTIYVPGPNTVPVYTAPDWPWTIYPHYPTPPGSAAMIVFQGGGNITVSDMTLWVSIEGAAENHRSVHDDPAVRYVVDYMLLVAHRPLLGSDAASPDEGVSVDNVKFKAPRFTSFTESSVRVGLGFAGALLTLGDGNVTATPFTGTHSVTNSTFDGPGIGVEAFGWTNGRLTVGGSETTPNTFVWGNHGVAIVDHDNSSFEISHNIVSSRDTGISVVQRRGKPRHTRTPPYFRPPSAPSKATITKNIVAVIEDSRINDGVTVIEGSSDPGIRIRDYGHVEVPPIYGNQQVVVTENDIMGSWVAGADYAVGIYDMGFGDVLMGNTISGSGAGAGIWVNQSQACRVLWNEVAGVTIHDGSARIALSNSKACTVLGCGVTNDVFDYSEPNNNLVLDWCGDYPSTP